MVDLQTRCNFTMKTVREIGVLWMWCFAIQIQLIQGVVKNYDESFASRCRNGWSRHGDSCYFLSKDVASWAEASMICTTLHSRLAVVESADENNFLKATARRFNAHSYLIAGTDMEVEGVWRWTATGDKISYLDWGGHDPNGGEYGNCVVMWRDFGYQWADESCHVARNFICEMSLDKTIFLSDPNYVQQRMTLLHRELQTLQATVLSQTGKMSSFKQHFSHSQNEIQSQNREIASIKQQLSEATPEIGGATFVRWGRKDCPTSLTELVYSGYAGGSWYNHKGAAASPLCLPRDPEWLNTTVVPDEDTGKLFGAEYASTNAHTMFGSNSRNKEVPCAVCRPKSFASSVMIPARTTCYNGWTKAYGGSLASGNHRNKAATEYVCMDEHPQPLAGGGNRNENGFLFYGVKAFCGSLRCPPYKQNTYISCVVCMK
ncbi:uncharacterized protein [Argopecten irradians]|uniref:uncharacterized protein n=1 Tax=Argopecten irradians TaxID=31199 RepID=UPI00371ACF5F